MTFAGTVTIDAALDRMQPSSVSPHLLIHKHRGACKPPIAPALAYDDPINTSPCSQREPPAFFVFPKIAARKGARAEYVVGVHRKSQPQRTLRPSKILPPARFCLGVLPFDDRGES